jgi:hypothetical protein
MHVIQDVQALSKAVRHPLNSLHASRHRIKSNDGETFTGWYRAVEHLSNNRKEEYRTGGNTGLKLRGCTLIRVSVCCKDGRHAAADETELNEEKAPLQCLSGLNHLA